MRVCVGAWRRSTRGSPGAHRGEDAGCWRAALGIPRGAGGCGGSLGPGPEGQTWEQRFQRSWQSH